jgi:hypothetical protein
VPAELHGSTAAPTGKYPPQTQPALTLEAEGRKRLPMPILIGLAGVAVVVGVGLAFVVASLGGGEEVAPGVVQALPQRPDPGAMPPPPPPPPQPAGVAAIAPGAGGGVAAVDPIEDPASADPTNPESPEFAPVEPASQNSGGARRPIKRAGRPGREPASSGQQQTGGSNPAGGGGGSPTPPPSGATTGTVAIVTPGGWANVNLGGRFLGQTPIRTNLPVGTHVLLFRPFGQPPGERITVTITAGGTSRVVRPLTAP